MGKYSKAQIKRNRKAWVEALRSGKYKQTRKKLKSRNGAYCCLGVVCELAELPSLFSGGSGGYYYGPEDKLGIVKDDGRPDGDWDHISQTLLPLAAQEWLGVSADEPKLAQPVTITDKFGDEVQVTNLVELNDTHRWTLGQIADAVEKYGLAE